MRIGHGIRIQFCITKMLHEHTLRLPSNTAFLCACFFFTYHCFSCRVAYGKTPDLKNAVSVVIKSLEISGNVSLLCVCFSDQCEKWNILRFLLYVLVIPIKRVEFLMLRTASTFCLNWATWRYLMMLLAQRQTDLILHSDSGYLASSDVCGCNVQNLHSHNTWDKSNTSFYKLF